MQLNPHTSRADSWMFVFVSLFVFVCLAEAEELNNRLQATKQRVSELERTLSSVSTQQKQFEKVTSIAVITLCK